MRPPSVLLDRVTGACQSGLPNELDVGRRSRRGQNRCPGAPEKGRAGFDDVCVEDFEQAAPADAAKHQSVRIVVLAPREVGLLVGVLVPALALLPLGEVSTARLVDARVTRLLALGEVATVLLLRRVGRLLLARREATVLVVVGVIVVIAVVVVTVLVVVTGIVVGMLAHVPWVSQRFL